MIITSVIRSLKSDEKHGKQVDIIWLEWYETTKRIQRVNTEGGIALGLRFMDRSMRLQDGDVLYEDEGTVIVVAIRPCPAICLHPETLQEMAVLCFELGNRHLSVFLQNDNVLLPYELAIYSWLEKSGYRPKLREEKLCIQANPDMGLYHRQRAYSSKDLTIKLG